MKLKTTFAAPAMALALALCGAFAHAAEQKAAAPAQAQQPVVTMYVMPECGYCEKARQHLKQAGFAWSERDISEPAINAEFRAKGGMGTPLLVIGDKVIKGWQPAAVDAALHRGAAN